MDVKGSRVLIMAADGFAELLETRQLLLDAGVQVSVAAPDGALIEGVAFAEPAAMAGAATRSVQPDLSISEVYVDAFDALVLPGGVRSPDTLRALEDAVAIVRLFAAGGSRLRPFATPHGCWWRLVW